MPFKNICPKEQFFSSEIEYYPKQMTNSSRKLMENKQ